MSLSVLAIYLTVSFFYIISPGPAVFLAITNGIRGGVLPLALSSLGNVVGLFFLSLISILGLGAIVLASATLFLMVKITGAIYLVYLGIKQFRESKAFSMGNQKNIEFGFTDKSLWSYFSESFMVAATNPKPILFFVAIFPQFLNTETAILPQFLILTLSFMVISFCSLFFYGYIGKQARHLLTRESAMKWFHRITGGLFIGMGIGLMKLKSVQ